MNESVRPPCSSVSLAMGESLNATALEGITLWLAIEVRSKWPTRIEMAIILDRLQQDAKKAEIGISKEEARELKKKEKETSIVE